MGATSNTYLIKKTQLKTAQIYLRVGITYIATCRSAKCNIGHLQKCTMHVPTTGAVFLSTQLHTEPKKRRGKSRSRSKFPPRHGAGTRAPGLERERRPNRTNPAWLRNAANLHHMLVHVPVFLSTQLHRAKKTKK